MKDFEGKEMHKGMVVSPLEMEHRLLSELKSQYGCV